MKKIILTENQYRLLLKENEKSLEEFHKENNIDKDNLSYLGKGDFGTAYSIGDGRVLKETNSKTEFEIAKQLENDNAKVLNAFAKIYKAEIVDGKMLIIKDEDGNILDVIPKPGVRTHYGFISQEIKSVLTELDPDKNASIWALADKEDETSEQMLQYMDFIAPIVKSIQEISARLDDLSQKLDELQG